MHLDVSDPNSSCQESPKAAAAVPGPPATKWAVFLFLIVLGAFLPVLRNGFVNYDDPVYVTENLQVQAGLTWEGVRWAFTNTDNANWHPVTWLSHMLDCALFGMRPWGHHLQSAVLHAVNAMLVFMFLHRFTGTLWQSLFVAALFGLHPLRVESVAWVAERKDVLSATFGLLSLWAFARYCTELRSATGRHRRFYLLALLAFAAGLMAKPMLVTLPFVLLLLDYWPLDRWRRGSVWTLVREKLPFMLMTVVASGVTYVAQQSAGAMDFAKTTLPWNARLANALVSYCRYLGTLVWPAHLSPFYPHPGHWPITVVLLSLLALLGVTALAVFARRRMPCLFTGWFWYLGTLVPVIGLVQVGEQSMADRYTYIPSLGALLMFVWSASELTANRRIRAPILRTAATVLVLCSALLTLRQILLWKDSETLFRHATKVTHDNHVAWHNLGLAVFERGRSEEALRCFQEVLRIKPSYVEEYSNLGMALDRLGRTDEAIAKYHKALALLPAYAEAYNNLGFALSKQGRLEEAEKALREAIRVKPGFARAYHNLGQLLEKQGRLEDAILAFQTAVRLNPWLMVARASLGQALNKTGRFDEAIGEYQAALRSGINDRDLHYNLGNALVRKGLLAEAIEEFQEGLQLQPDDAEAHNNLGVAFFQLRHYDDAIRHFREALRIKPDYAEAERNLATASRAKEGGHSTSPRP